MKIKIGKYISRDGELEISASLLVKGLYEIDDVIISDFAFYSLTKSSEKEIQKHEEVVKYLSSNIEMLNKILNQYNQTYEIIYIYPYYSKCVDVSHILEGLNVKNIKKKLALCGKPDLVLEVRSKEARYKTPVEIKLEGIFNKNKNKTIVQIQAYSFIFATDAFGLIFSLHEQPKLKEVIHIPYSLEVQKIVEKLIIELIKKLKIPGAGFEPAASRFL
jgi:hypothetical protein